MDTSPETVMIDKDSLEKLVSHFSSEAGSFSDYLQDGDISLTLEGAKGHIFYHLMVAEESLYKQVVADIDFADQVIEVVGSAAYVTKAFIVAAMEYLDESVDVVAGGTVANDFSGSIKGVKLDTDGSLLVIVEDYEGDCFDVTMDQIELGGS